MQEFEPSQPVRLPQFILFTLMLLFLIAPAGEVRAASITVDENCSLRDAIAAANQDAAVGGCPAGSGADTLTLTIDITLTEALPAITAGMTIEGNNHSISGDNQYSILVVAESRLAINNLTLVQGFGSIFGGGIYASDSQVEIVDSEIKDSSAGAGGGIYFSSSSGTHTLDIAGSSFTGSSSAGGGGALKIAGGTVTIKGSGFAFNTSDKGGAIESTNATLHIENSTFSGNEARLGGGLSSFDAEVALTHTTWAYNSASETGGAVHLEGWNGTIKLRNTLMAGSRAGGDCNSGLNPDSITENVASFIQDGSCSPMLTGDPLLGDVAGSPAYLPLREGSAAIDRADDRYCPADDQSGTARPQGAACEIGAYEFPGTTEPLEALLESSPTAALTPSPTSSPAATALTSSPAALTPSPTLSPAAAMTSEPAATPTSSPAATPTPSPSLGDANRPVDASRLGLVAAAFVLVGTVMVYRLRNETGQSLVEYTLILAVVAVVIIVILALISPSIDNILANIIKQLNTSG